jgi:hypothetical protein
MDPVRSMIRLTLLMLCGFLAIQAVSASCTCSTPCSCPFGTPCTLPPRPVFLTTVLADFTQDVISGAAPLTVQFTDRSSGRPNYWLWDFGDGSTSSQQNPVHTYSDSGTYTVTLTAGMVYDQGSFHSGISTVISKEDLITVSGLSQTIQPATESSLANPATPVASLSAAEVKMFLSQRSIPFTTGQVALPAKISGTSPASNGETQSYPTGVFAGDRVPGKEQILQHVRHLSQNGPTASTLLNQRVP